MIGIAPKVMELYEKIAPTVVIPANQFDGIYEKLAEMIGKETYRKVSYEVIGDYAGDYILLDEGDMISEVWGENN